MLPASARSPLCLLMLCIACASAYHPPAQGPPLLVGMDGAEAGLGVYALQDGAPGRMFGTPAHAPVEMAVDVGSGVLYWIEGGSRFDVGTVVRRATLDGTEAATVLRADAVDAEAFADVAFHDGALYLIDFDTKFSRQPPRILRVEADGQSPDVLVEGDLSEPVALAVGAGAVVWADGQRLLKVGLDGSGRTVLHTSEQSIQDVAIDDGQVYWVARSGEAELGRVGLDGTGAEVLMTEAGESDLASVTDLDVQDGRAVWVSEGMFSEYAVVEASLDGSSSKQTVSLGRYAYDGFSTGVEAKIKDAALAGDALYLADQASHNIARVQEGERTRTVLTPPIYGIRALAVSAGTGAIYWADARLGINRAEPDGSSPTIVMPQAASFEVQGLAVDPESELIYWASPDGGITRATLDRSVFEGIVRPGGNQNVAPTDIALDLANGHVYWMNNDARVMRARLDGSEVEELATGLGAPGPIAVDPANGALYWVDRGSFSDDPPPQMVRAQLDGSDATVLDVPVSHGTVDLVVDAEAGMLYWGNTDQGAVFRAKLDGTEAEAFLSVRQVIHALALVP